MDMGLSSAITSLCLGKQDTVAVRKGTDPREEGGGLHSCSCHCSTGPKIQILGGKN